MARAPTDESQSAARQAAAARAHHGIKVLLVDDEQRFRENLRERLTLRGFSVDDVGNPLEAIRRVRASRPDVVLLDRKMPEMSGEEVLKEVKRLAPEVQVVILTGHASIDSATYTGRLDAFAYLEKPCETDVLVSTIEAAAQEKRYAMARRQIPQVQGRSLFAWLKGTHNHRPGFLLLGALILLGGALAPTPASLRAVVQAARDPAREAHAGVANAPRMTRGASVTEVGFKAPKMIATLLLAIIFWATGAMPIGMTAFLVAVLMYLFGILSPEQVAQAYAKDAVIFILGVLVFSAGVSKTGLDRRIGLWLLSTTRSVGTFLFVFCPLLALATAFISDHALVAFLGPILMLVYVSAVRQAGLKQDKALMVLMVLAMCYSANQGGPGSVAAGGRNAVMIAILADYGGAPSFAEWVKYGLPFVPVMALTIAAYFYVMLRRKLQVGTVDIAKVVRAEGARIGPLTKNETLVAVVLVLVIAMWMLGGERFGLGGPVLVGIVVLAVLRILTWPDVNKISWDVVALYGAATALGTGLSVTGGAFWLAGQFLHVLPRCLAQGNGLAMAASFCAGVLTNFMGDGATISAIGPVAVPMATLSGTHPWRVGFATAFAASFANCLIIGTPNNAIAYSLAKDPETGEQLVTLADFARHGVVITLLAFAVLWVFVISGYWNWIGL